MESGLQIRNISRQGAIPNNNKKTQKQTKNQTRTEQLTTNVYDVFSALTSIFSRFKNVNSLGEVGMEFPPAWYNIEICYVTCV